MKKLNAVAIKSSSKAHDLYVVEEYGIQIAILSIRRSSSMEIGHDYLKNDLYISPRQAKDLGQCPLSRDEYIAIMREKGILPVSDAESNAPNP